MLFENGKHIIFCHSIFLSGKQSVQRKADPKRKKWRVWPCWISLVPPNIMDLMFEWEYEGDRFSFEDSDRFEEDSLCSWGSEPELCNNWRGWKRQNGGQGLMQGLQPPGTYNFSLLGCFLCVA